MLVTVFSPKGGVGTSVCASLFAKALSQHQKSLVVDACNGDLDAIVGLDTSTRYSFDDWASSEEPSSDSIEQISVHCLPNLVCVSSKADRAGHHIVDFANPSRIMISHSVSQRQKIVEALSSFEGHCVVDVGTRTDELALDIASASDVVVMTLRECYLGLYRAMSHPFRELVDACVVVQESGRSITTKQIIQSLSLNVVIEIDARRDFARAIDAGVLIHRTPENLLAPIDSYVKDVIKDAGSIQSIDVFEDSEARNSQPFWEPEQKNKLREREFLIMGNKYSKHARSVLKER